jgi:hypothetical protein
VRGFGVGGEGGWCGSAGLSCRRRRAPALSWPTRDADIVRARNALPHRTPLRSCYMRQIHTANTFYGCFLPSPRAVPTRARGFNSRRPPYSLLQSRWFHRQTTVLTDVLLLPLCAVARRACAAPAPTPGGGASNGGGGVRRGALASFRLLFRCNGFPRDHEHTHQRA